MLFSKCIELKKLIVRYNRSRVSEDNFVTYDFSMYADGQWSCVLETSGFVDVVDFMPVLEWAATLYVSPFMWGDKFGFNLHMQ